MNAATQDTQEEHEMRNRENRRLFALYEKAKDEPQRDRIVNQMQELLEVEGKDLADFIARRRPGSIWNLFRRKFFPVLTAIALCCPGCLPRDWSDDGNYEFYKTRSEVRARFGEPCKSGNGPPSDSRLELAPELLDKVDSYDEYYIIRCSFGLYVDYILYDAEDRLIYAERIFLD